MMNTPTSEHLVFNVNQSALHKNKIFLLLMQRNRRSENNSSILEQLRSHQESVVGNKSIDVLPPKNERRVDQNKCFKALRDGFILIIATIAVYILICLFVFLFVLWLSKRSHRGCGQVNFVGISNISENSVLIQTPTTLMSHR